MSRLYEFNERAFESIADEQSAYWLGFLAADGSCGRWTTRLALAIKDADHVRLFADWIQTTAPIVVSDRALNGKTFSIATLDINSVALVRRLIGHGLVKQKSIHMQPPTTVPEHLIRHWARGIFDGDGHVGHYTSGRYRKENCRLVGTADVIPWFAEQVKMATGCPAAAITKRHPDRPGLTLVYSGRQRILKVCDWMYEGATVSLRRKADEIEFIKNWKRPYIWKHDQATVSRKS